MEELTLRQNAILLRHVIVDNKWDIIKDDQRAQNFCKYLISVMERQKSEEDFGFYTFVYSQENDYNESASEAGELFYRAMETDYKLPKSARENTKKFFTYARDEHDEYTAWLIMNNIITLRNVIAKKSWKIIFDTPEAREYYNWILRKLEKWAIDEFEWNEYGGFLSADLQLVPDEDIISDTGVQKFIEYKSRKVLTQ